ncbi:uncharacterized protein LOC107371747 [Tetranychus urticae]|uniref:HIG1 domain-containing protein n=1 Tax=Tetranychus urticae TaxID=32264 RepID=T1JVG2_TETUR|nr:uncharacterized protein LOC107371747 [Tetranychus urticae]
MANNSTEKTNGIQADSTGEYDKSSGKSPLEWLEIKEGIEYSQLPRISGERNFLNQLGRNPIIVAGMLGGLVAIGGGLASVRSRNHRLSNHFLKLRWGSSSLVFVFVLSQIWDKIDWNPPAVQKLQKYINETFKKDIRLFGGASVTETPVALNVAKKSP